MRPKQLLSSIIATAVAASLVLSGIQPAAGSPQANISASVSPSSASIGSQADYTIVVTASGGLEDKSVNVKALIPATFKYTPGSTSVNGTPAKDPVISGSQLTWKGLPSIRRPGSTPFGVHTFVQDAMSTANIDKQLSWSGAISGGGGFVKQLMYNISPSTQGPKPEWVDFVNAAYDRGLTPVVRLQGVYDGAYGYWKKPVKDADGTYRTAAAAFKRVIKGLPRRSGHQLFVEIWNEPNLNAEWGGHPNPGEYGRFLLDTSRAIRSLGYPEVKVLNGGMGPDTQDYPNYLDAMLTAVPALLYDNGGKPVFDYWATHPYPQNHPPEYNYHNGSRYVDSAVDSYWLQLGILGKHGLKVGTPQNPGVVKVVITETGYELGNRVYAFEGFPAIDETNRADYMKRAFRDYWSKWPEVVAVCPYELSDPYGQWAAWDWVYPDSGTNPDGSPSKVHPQYSAVKSTPRPAPQLTIKFSARTGGTLGTHNSTFWAMLNGVKVGEIAETAPVTVTGIQTNPSSVKAGIGKWKSGDHNSLGGNDSSYYVLGAAPLDGAYQTSSVAVYHLAAAPDKLAIHYSGRTSIPGPSVRVQILNVRTGLWVTLASWTGTTTEREESLLAPGEAAKYLNNAGDVKVRVKTSGGTGHQSQIDLLGLVTSN